MFENIVIASYLQVIWNTTKYVTTKLKYSYRELSQNKVVAIS